MKFQSKKGLLGESQELATEMVREIVDVEIAPGMSGGPVLDTRRGYVCGVTKTRRKANDNLGGLFIPAEFIQQVFKKEAWLPNQRASAVNSRWQEQRDAVLDELEPAAFRLSEQEHRLLAMVAADLRLTGGDLTRAWGDIVELPPQRAFSTLNDLIADLADRTWNELDPITKLFIWLACHDRTTTDKANDLLNCARTRAPHQRLLIVRYEKRFLEQNSAPRNPVLLVRLRPDPPSATRTFILDIWRYADRGENQRAVPVVTDAGPYGLLVARKVIIDTLNEQVKLVGEGPVIEFALPDVLLDHAVEEWDGGNGIPLGEKFPIVVRLAEREIDGTSYVDTLRSRAAQFWQGSVPPEGTHAWDRLWLTCRSLYTPRELNRVLRQNPRLPMVAMTAWHGRGRALKAIKAAKEAGVAVIVWRHTKCAGDGCPAGGDRGGGDRVCPGTLFKREAADHVAGVRLAALPEKIFKARAGQPPNGALGYRSPGIALIWDDPALLPWAAGTPNLYPRQPAGWEDVEQLADLPGTG